MQALIRGWVCSGGTLLYSLASWIQRSFYMRENYIGQHYSVIFKLISWILTNMKQKRLLNYRTETEEHPGHWRKRPTFPQISKFPSTPKEGKERKSYFLYLLPSSFLLGCLREQARYEHGKNHLWIVF